MVGDGATWTPRACVRPGIVTLNCSCHLRDLLCPSGSLQLEKQVGEALPPQELQSYKNVETIFADPCW